MKVYALSWVFSGESPCSMPHHEKVVRSFRKALQLRLGLFVLDSMLRSLVLSRPGLRSCTFANQTLNEVFWYYGKLSSLWRRTVSGPRSICLRDRQLTASEIVKDVR